MISQMRFGRTWLRLATLACALAAPGIAHAGVSFSSASYPLPAANSAYHQETGAVSAVDLNNDGKRDIVVYRGGGDVGQVYVLLNKGDGTFGAAQTYSGCANSDNGGLMVTGQFDAGQAADVILGCEAGTGLDLLLGNGDGSLGTNTNSSSIGFNDPLALWPGDDGAYPAVLYTQSAGEFYLCYRTVTDLGTPQCPPDTSASDANGPSGHAAVGRSLATGHFYSNATCNRDDVIVGPYLRGFRAWALNPFGNLSVPACSSFAYVERSVQGIPAGEDLVRISTADLTGDGTPDLLMSTDGSSLVALPWLGGSDVDGGFPPGQQSIVTPTISGIEDQQIADFDGDGHLDVALVGETPGATTATLAIQTGHGDGSFDTSPATFAIPGGSPDTYNSIGPNRLAVGDLNGDGKPDLVSIAVYDGAVTVLLNGSIPPTTPVTPASSGDSSSNPIAPVTPAVLPPDKTAPAVTALSLSNKKFAVGPAATAKTALAKRGTTLHYTLSEAARVSIAIARQSKGWRKGSGCAKSPPKRRRAKRCALSTLQGTLVRSGSPGANAVVFSGRIGSKALALGAYKMSVTAVDAAGNKSKVLALPFTVVHR